MRELKLSITVKDVSDRAGVSVATVSRTFSDPDKVRPKTREKVLEAARAVNFVPNVMARNLRAQKAYTILVLIPDISNPFFSHIVEGIEKAATEAGYAVLLGNTSNDKKREDDLANLIVSKQADGIIQLNARIPTIVAQKLKAGEAVNFVNACDCVKDVNIDRVMIDNESAAEAVIKLLTSLGHKKIGVISGPEETPLTERRLIGCQKVSGDHQLFVKSGDFSMMSGRTAAERLLQSGFGVSAIFCFNDEMAIGAMQAIREAGKSVADDISVVGFDNIKFAKFTEPSLTTVAQPQLLLGEVAMKRLLTQIQDSGTKPEATIVEHELLMRDSIGSAPVPA